MGVTTLDNSVVAAGVPPFGLWRKFGALFVETAVCLGGSSFALVPHVLVAVGVMVLSWL